MINDNLNAVGLLYGEKVLLRFFAEQTKADYNTVLRLAKKFNAITDAGGGAYYINVQKYLDAKEADDNARKAEKNARKTATGAASATIETTTNTPLLRGQLKRLGNLNEKHQARIAEIDRMLKTERDQQRKSDLQTEREDKRSKVEHNQGTLAKVEKRLHELDNNSVEGTVNQ